MRCQQDRYGHNHDNDHMRRWKQPVPLGRDVYDPDDSRHDKGMDHDLLRAPQPGEVVAPAAPAVQQTRRDYGPAEVLKTPVFWVMYAPFA
jgi:hypothetical protein